MLISLGKLLFFDNSLSDNEKKDIVLKNELMSKILAKIISETPTYHDRLLETYTHLISRFI
ncbi:MAG: hypothetical protein F6K08_11285 [Okeania sp. SIO1H6]|uniref:hypothetical protein n=1 Tax=Okeania TaxID=1458928 RepID=UPI000F5421C1|nr:MULTISPECIES: hypothetical protein [Okeania]NET13389.1 hypothetical protein [Okeania sp. SIO1H6]NEP71899.1 hypothetical protein [Okeania sp. SIO2G5]NEP93057.1 hypothetical protein [Okeania sp. SIO2F5]NEQ90725.1 hypothetical protein [Okeania sp. SIO2G4]NET19949.1 hypothetical protein [Okeania sp. SIO1H5]